MIFAEQPGLPPFPDGMSVVEWLAVASFVVGTFVLVYLVVRGIPAIISALNQIPGRIDQSFQESRANLNADWDQKVERLDSKLERLLRRIET